MAVMRAAGRAACVVRKSASSLGGEGQLGREGVRGEGRGEGDTA